MTSTTVTAGPFSKVGPLRKTVEPPDAPRRSRDEIAPDVRTAIRGCSEGHNAWPLCLLGETGAGKTCAALAMIDHWGGWYTTVAELHETVNRARMGELTWSSGYKKTLTEVWHQWSTANVAVLDELGVREPSDARLETILQALNGRWGKPTVVCSNLSMEQVASVCDERIASRLAEGTVVVMRGDRRLG